MSEKSSTQTLKFKLNSLLEITRAINDNQPVNVLLESYVDILCNKLNIGKVVMFKHQDGWECILSAGVPTDVVHNIKVEENLFSYTEITFVTSEQDILPGFDIVIPVYNNYVPIAYVLIGDIEEEMEGVSPVIKHLHFIQTISNIIVVAIENIRLFQDSLQQEALRKELELASQMQNMLVPNPRDLPRNQHLLMNAFYKPHYEVGGDYFDCIELGDNKLGFCVADVSGKGMAAALLMSNFQATLRALFTSEISMDSLLQKLNKRVYESAQGEKFITIFIARFDYDTHQLEYANAGHTPVILYRTDSKNIKLLESACLAIGMLERLPFISVRRLTIMEHSLMLSYTDGLVELLSDTGEGGVKSAFYVLESAIQHVPDIDGVINEVIDTQNLNGNNHAIFDDITLLGIEFFA
ncbi:MAG: PP2C family protein-serine/threonine phosphatase [Bacteroidales bacterium]|jgi:sigma-B regulation protein RsbU (phosphoserine phosphatase)|nr:PP2C family protein-serine/threonine phosphatase [Bacteroidales bacterium]